MLPPPGATRTVGDAIQRVTYHYWFHIGEILAIRQLLGHPIGRSSSAISRGTPRTGDVTPRG